jgi:hypothetical protein
VRVRVLAPCAFVVALVGSSFSDQSNYLLTAASPLQALRFDGGRTDRPGPMAVDGAGNVYVGGSVDQTTNPVSFAVIKYNAAGALQWRSHYVGAADEFAGTPAGLGVDQAGNVYAAGYILRHTGTISSDVDWLVVSFAPDGAVRWTHRSHSGFDAATSVVVLGDAIYIGGITGVDNDFDWLVRRYSTAGAIVWQDRLAGIAGADDRPISTVVDPSGNLLVAGYTSNIGVGLAKDITTVKYSADGARLWASTFTETAQSDEMPGGIAVDASGAAYVTGETVPSTNPELVHVPLTVKYNAAGQQLFVLRGDGAGGSSVAVDPFGDIVVNGASFREGGNPGVTAVTKFTANGQQVWLRQVPIAGLLSVGVQGEVFLGGTLVEPGTSDGFDLFAMKFDRAGQELWRSRYAPGYRSTAQALGAQGVFYLTGDSGMSAIDIITLKFPADFVPGPTLPAAPTNLTASPAPKQIRLTWRDNASNETGFRIERCTGAGCANFTTLTTLGQNVTTFTSTGLSKNTTYGYRVLALSGTSASGPSNVVYAKPK